MSKRADKNLIVGLDIGTSKVVAIVGELNDDGVIEVVGIGSHPSRGLKKGVVVNIESTVHSIQRGGSTLINRDHPAHREHRPEQRVDISQEGHQRSQRHFARHHAVTPHPQNDQIDSGRQKANQRKQYPLQSRHYQV